jgi:hypothetical protein
VSFLDSHRNWTKFRGAGQRVLLLPIWVLWTLIVTGPSFGEQVTEGRIDREPGGELEEELYLFQRMHTVPGY